MIGHRIFDMLRFSKGALEDRSGATAMEYELMVALISVVIIGAVSTIGNELNTLFISVGNCLTNVASCAALTGGGGTTP